MLDISRKGSIICLKTDADVQIIMFSSDNDAKSALSLYVAGYQEGKHVEATRSANFMRNLTNELEQINSHFQA